MTGARPGSTPDSYPDRPRDDATAAQVRAASPSESTWLAANAGSGKTRVLTDRVARLLLDGVLPEHILCLTYTKAAASEMQNRLFRRLGAWAMLEDDALAANLAELGVDAVPDRDALRRARTLFARAIETPGGLRIQTIHSFCAALLRRFPLESGVSPRFTEIEDRAAQLLREDILDRMAEGPQAALVEAISDDLPDDPAPLLAEIVRRRDAFDPPPSDAAIAAAYDLPPGTTAETLLAEVFADDTLAFLHGLVPDLMTGGKTDQTLAETFRGIAAADLSALETLEGALLTGAGAKEPYTAKIGRMPTKALQKKAGLSEAAARLDHLAARVEAARDCRLALAAAARDAALARFAGAFLQGYETEKTRRGWLDFDDLIRRARDLLSAPGVAEWVLYRLDGGIDHILVDEAQDTAPAQWEVIERLAREFTAGQGARADVPRTIFVVGDKKQSIYSFQGADPTGFDRMREDFAERLQSSGAPLNRMALEYSFRSAEPILRLVDTVFDGAQESGFTPDQRHRAFHEVLPGRVDLWPVVAPTEDEEDGPWHQPVDRVARTHHDVILAARIARFIRRTVDAGTPLPDLVGGKAEARPVKAGDFLVLVRSRGRLFSEIIRAAKAEDLPIAGADVLRVMSELAVRDVLALLRFLATPEDDLSLATALRSPLFGATERQLFDLAHGRGKRFLWQVLRADPGPLAEARHVLGALRDQTDFLRPYDLIERILTRHDGRRRLIGRLGPEAEDGLDALLAQALSYEATEVPSLTGFLHWAQSDDLRIKRAPDAAGQTLRVMTVHGAKGLEAPIVILPDCADPRPRHRDTLLTDADGALWKRRAEDQPARQRRALDAAMQANAQETDRLLYVALTRAEKWLVVAAAGSLGAHGTAWHDKVRVAMEQAGAAPQAFPFDDAPGAEGLRLDGPPWPEAAASQPATATPDLPALPPHLARPAPEPAHGPGTRSPSDLGGAKALPGDAGEDETTAKARGTAIHALIEHLSALGPADRAAAGPQLAAVLVPDALAADRPALLAEAQAVLDAPALAPIFAPDTLAETPVTADTDVGRMHGTIDRLVLTADRILAVDFKTNRTVPQTPETVPEGLLRQMGAYAAALARIYPGRRIETAIVWTATATLMPLPETLTLAAFARVPRLDASGGGPYVSDL